ncbi:hypothetical protein DDE82_003491 [Stemphylium lycopersici]|uniref:F-box domain-containing protein n=1 Tax=Stemphylium lycopersici TaxID=183478 RepID=A0A364NC79_STELY|nr:hypothetical protein TW65_00555 [Stemphylium lycopersici]RAR06143.1 hypothetical protein DDE82_003491 [Stemphylium lycopersici]RAR14862.1 hypothetical protein DDE83_001700 [Stemphylium lycopersici]
MSLVGLPPELFGAIINNLAPTIMFSEPLRLHTVCMRKRYVKDLTRALVTGNKAATVFMLEEGHMPIGRLTESRKREQNVQCMLAAAAGVECLEAVQHYICHGAPAMQRWSHGVFGFSRSTVAAGCNSHSEVRAYLLE